MSKLPVLIPGETIEIPSDCYWVAGQDENLYWWKKPEEQIEQEYLALNLHSEGISTKKEIPINSSSCLLFADKDSNLYFGQTLTIGNRVTVFRQDGDLLWSWEPDEKINSIAHTVDAHGQFWYVSSDVGFSTTKVEEKAFSVSPGTGLTEYPFPRIDMVYGIAISEHETIYSNQLPAGHYILCSDYKGNIIHKIGAIDPGKGDMDNAADWEVFYPENIFLDSKDRLWIDEMGRDCITIVASNLNIIGRLDHDDFGLRSPLETQGRANGKFEYGFGDKLLWVKEARYTPEIILHSYRIEDN